ncbi:MAG: hypothetical protein IT320_09635 [Anaerolineae bacterium]|nr:hypothetical protein [Anaerolineae bacterium]
MESLEAAILRTVLYADVFNFPLTLAEIHHFLIASTPASLAQIEEALARSPRLRDSLCCIDGFFMRVGREDLIDLRRSREDASQALWDAALSYGRWMARVPFVRMVALTGALAVRNAVASDDIDYLIVTRGGRVWMARAFAILLVRLARLRGVELCPNYVLAENALAQERQDIFMAHEVAQMIPLYGRALYERMRHENGWVLAQMPNAQDAFHDGGEADIGGGWRLIKRALEGLLGGALGDAFEAWERARKLRRFAPKLQSAYHHARLDAQHVKGHFNDHGHPALHAYIERLRAYQIEDA